MKELWNAPQPTPRRGKSVKCGMFLSEKLNNNFVPYFSVIKIKDFKREV
ncbi:MAG: hypothetical protein PUC16_06875 [Bacteroidales bacterium]|nr:hypothetical protein [Bacteroidales bacterium]